MQALPVLFLFVTTMTNKHNESAHGGNQVTKAFASVVLPIAAVAGLVFYLVSADHLQPGYAPVSISADAQAMASGQRIQKVGTVSMGDANRPLASGEDVFKAQCSACHTSGAAGAPKYKDAAAWSGRIGQGLPALVNSALKGKNAMGAQGGGSYNDLEITRAVVYLANAGGAKFAEPQAPAAAASGASAAQPAKGK